MQSESVDDLVSSIVGAFKQTWNPITSEINQPSSAMETGSVNAPATNSASADLVALLSRPARELSVEPARVNQPTAESSPASQALTDLAQILSRAQTSLPTVGSSSRESEPRAKSKEDSGSSLGSTVLKTIGLATGVGPLAAGLLSLFGLGGKKEPVPEPIAYEAPGALSVEAGLTADRGFTDIAYSEAGTARSADSRRSANAGSGQAPSIQVTVNAMDSRSFLDRSDDIAKAVREAMLNSHSLNDVIADL